jgi:hypothetical protein
MGAGAGGDGCRGGYATRELGQDCAEVGAVQVLVLVVVVVVVVVVGFGTGQAFHDAVVGVGMGQEYVLGAVFVSAGTERIVVVVVGRLAGGHTVVLVGAGGGGGGGAISIGGVGLAGDAMTEGGGTSQYAQGTVHWASSPVGAEAVQTLSGGPTLNSSHWQCSLMEATNGRQIRSVMPPSRPR